MDTDTAYPRLLSAWCVAIFSVAAVAAVALLATGERVGIGPLLLLGALCAFAEHIIVRLPNGSSVSASVMVSLAAVFVFRDSAPLAGPLLVGMAGGIYWPHIRRRDWRRLGFNIGALGLSSLAAAGAFALIAQSAHSVVSELLGAIGAAVAYWVVDVALLAMTMRIKEGGTLPAQVQDLWGFADFEIVVFAILGVFLGRLYEAHGVLIVALFITPILAARQAFASYLAVHEQHEATLAVLVHALEAKDPYTGGHVERVAQFATYVGAELGFSPSRLRRLHDAALMHDIGKLTVPNRLLNKPGRLTRSEYAEVRRHEGISVALVRRIEALAPCAAAIGGEFEGPGAPLESRIIHVADAFDAMTSTRAYRRAMPQEEAVAELRRNVGHQFDADCVQALVQVLDRRGERYGAGVEAIAASAQFEVPPPSVGVGSAGLGDLAPEP
jgi:HD-GYP domain-containing protein (c-di-GMP phosphodiesterase class II)